MSEGTGMYGTRATGELILAVARGICPPHGPISHTCDEAAGMTFVMWWRRDLLLDDDGNCRFCGERV